MENETNETWRDRKRRELMEKQTKMAYELARISIEIKKLREEPPVPEGSVPLSMIEPLINETVERLMLLKEAKKPKPERLTADRILNAIGHPDLILKRVVHRLENSRHKRGWKFVSPAPRPTKPAPYPKWWVSFTSTSETSKTSRSSSGCITA